MTQKLISRADEGPGWRGAVPIVILLILFAGGVTCARLWGRSGLASFAAALLVLFLSVTAVALKRTHR
jgi:hypothetical protein